MQAPTRSTPPLEAGTSRERTTSIGDRREIHPTSPNKTRPLWRRVVVSRLKRRISSNIDQNGGLKTLPACANNDPKAGARPFDIGSASSRTENRHGARCRGDAEFIEQRDQLRVRALVVDQKAGVNGRCDAIEGDVNRVRVSAKIVVGFEQRDAASLSMQQPCGIPSRRYRHLRSQRARNTPEPGSDALCRSVPAGKFRSISVASTPSWISTRNASGWIQARCAGPGRD